MNTRTFSTTRGTDFYSFEAEHSQWSACSEHPLTVIGGDPCAAASSTLRRSVVSSRAYSGHDLHTSPISRDARTSRRILSATGFLPPPFGESIAAAGPVVAGEDAVGAMLEWEFVRRAGGRVWRIDELPDCPQPGDKGAGLQQLVNAGLRIPRTLVFTRRSDWLSGEVRPLDEAAVFDSLDVPADGRVLARSSLIINREMAPAISGLYPSTAATRGMLASTLQQVSKHQVTPDRVFEEVAVGTVDELSSGMCVLVQPWIQPDFSGVAHVRSNRSVLSVHLGIVDGHLSPLVEGKVEGWQAELANIQLDGIEQTALIADETIAQRILDLPQAPAALGSLRNDLARFAGDGPCQWEVEWAAVGGIVYYLQAQPLTGDDD